MSRLTEEQEREIEIQETLDKYLEENPVVEQYVMKIYYVPSGAEIPPAVTHMVRLTAVDEPTLELRLGVVATPNTTAIANVILGLIGRSAPDPKDE
jgi:hypothetical protein